MPYLNPFHKDWSPQKIVANINEAYNNRTYEFGNTYSGIGSDGIEISVYLDKNGEIISDFPSE
ncbi:MULTISPECIES: EndoU domain-containing protein [Bacillus]|uniref:EndoU domain-containing protein n=1 Tax=Bacillus TaxID=1386 RepID=UPI000873307E|nr:MULTISPECIES: EndoU domain-containing protein [Bacillus cereus group]